MYWSPNGLIIAASMVTVSLTASSVGCQSNTTPSITKEASEEVAEKVDPKEQVEPAAALSGAELQPFKADEGMGYRTKDGVVQIPPQFQRAQDFDKYDKAEVYDDEGWAYIDPSGDILVRAYPYDNGTDYFKEGLARYVDGDKVGFINHRAEVVIEAQFSFATAFSDGRAKVCTGCKRESVGEHSRFVGGQWWEIDKDGNKIAELDAP